MARRTPQPHDTFLRLTRGSSGRTGSSLINFRIVQIQLTRAPTKTTIVVQIMRSVQISLVVSGPMDGADPLVTS